MLPPKSRDARAGNGAAGDPAPPEQASAALAEDRMSHLHPTHQAHRAADRSSADAARPAGDDPGALVIGGGVELKGRIGSCDTLVVEGTVESTIECRSIEIRASGVVTGEATVGTATVQGRFDGNLVVTGCLTVRAGGCISGSVRYGEIEIERGAEIVGDIATVATVASEPVASEPVEAAAATTEPEAPPPDPAAAELAARIEAL